MTDKKNRLERLRTMGRVLDHATIDLAEAHARLVTLAKNAWATMHGAGPGLDVLPDSVGDAEKENTEAAWFARNALDLHWKLAEATDAIISARNLREEEEHQVTIEICGLGPDDEDDEAREVRQ